MPIPKSVTVIVYGGQCLKAKKGGGAPLAWVVFGFGKNKCCTAQVRDTNPKWNEENNFTITDPKAPLKLTVKDRDDTLGQIQMPLTDIPHEEHTFKWIPIGPHRKNLNPFGEICIDCWIVDYTDGEAPRKDTQLLKLKNRLTLRSTGNDGQRKGSLQTGGRSMKGSVSVEDLSGDRKSKTLGRLPSAVLGLPSGLSRASSTYFKKSNSPTYKQTASDVFGTSPVNTDLKITEKIPSPEIKLITPISGPVSGGTLVNITGKNLGKNKLDIVSLEVAGSDCLATLEYYSPEKLMCTTTAGQGVGSVVLTTESGGTCKSRVQFEFTDLESDDAIDSSLSRISNDKRLINGSHEKKGPNGRSFSLTNLIPDKRGSSQELKKEVEELTNEVNELRTENSELKEYLDRLLLYIMERYPEALESRRLYR